jgi:integrase
MTDSKRRFKFSTASITDKALPPGPSSTAKDILYFDTKTTGFGIRVGRARPNGEPPVRTFFAMRDLPGGKTKRVSIGRFPSPYGVERAREEAEELLIKMKKGTDPIAEAREKEDQKVTLRDAVARHLERMRTSKKQPRSIRDLEGDMERYFGSRAGGAGWLDRELTTIRRAECDDLHMRFTKERGEYAANRALRAFRAVWNSATRRYEGLPTCPTASVEWNPEERKRSPIAWAVMPDFWRAIGELKNPVRADLVRVLALTGLRSQDCRSIRWSEVNFDDRTLFRPNPKGGPTRAFRVPICAEVVRILERRRAENVALFGETEWVFPTLSRSGGKTYIKNAEEDSLHVYGYTPHRLRDSYISAAHECGVPRLTIKACVNHALPKGDETDGYIRPDVSHLRDAVEKVARFLLDKAKAKAEAA